MPFSAKRLDLKQFFETRDALMHVGNAKKFKQTYALLSGVAKRKLYCGPNNGFRIDVDAGAAQCVPRHVLKNHVAGLVPLVVMQRGAVVLEHYIAFVRTGVNLLWFDPARPKTRRTRQSASYENAVRQFCNRSATRAGLEERWVVPETALQPDPCATTDPLCSLYCAAFIFCARYRPLALEASLQKGACVTMLREATRAQALRARQTGCANFGFL